MRELNQTDVIIMERVMLLTRKARSLIVRVIKDMTLSNIARCARRGLFYKTTNVTVMRVINMLN